MGLIETQPLEMIQFQRVDAKILEHSIVQDFIDHRWQ